MHFCYIFIIISSLIAVNKLLVEENIAIFLDIRIKGLECNDTVIHYGHL